MIRTATALLALLVTACGGATAAPQRSNNVSGSVVVSFKAADGATWKARLTDPADIANARELLAGKEAPRIPNGKIVRGSPDVNTGWSWHLDPNDFEWADVATEVCDGNPENVEDGSLTSDRYCPWSATVVAVEPAAS
jgi:hypothetical protein